MMMQYTYTKEFYDAYVEAALWSSTDGIDDLLDKNYGPEDIEEYSAKEMLQDCIQFVEDHWELLRPLGATQCGYDFWLTRNHHGTGFWDRGWGIVGELLANAAHVYGECNLYVGDDGKIHVA